MSGNALMELGAQKAFQADEESSIPFTRSNVFNVSGVVVSVIPTSGLLLIPTAKRRPPRCKSLAAARRR
jgi:hypothetical protein